MKYHIHHIHIFILSGLILTGLLLIILNKTIEDQISKSPITFGISFSSRYASELGLDPRKTYMSILEDLNVSHIRIPAYWDEIEPFDKSFYFDDLDWYINEASKHSARVILAIGYKLPRWPECRAPEWLNSSNLRERQLNMLAAVIDHYDSNTAISSFQLENEPLLDFGDCPKTDRAFLKKEIDFVRSKTKKPIILTDSGELKFWKTPMQLSDIFGTTLYRVVDTPWIGPFQYPLRPWYYRLKSDLIRKFFAQNNQKTIISELQAEPWSNQLLTKLSTNEQITKFSLDSFKETIDFARKTGFDEAYFWGVEWWYYSAKKGHPEYLNFAKLLF